MASTPGMRSSLTPLVPSSDAASPFSRCDYGLGPLLRSKSDDSLTRTSVDKVSLTGYLVPHAPNKFAGTPWASYADFAGVTAANEPLVAPETSPGTKPSSGNANRT
jgi:hypothetical protein